MNIPKNSIIFFIISITIAIVIFLKNAWISDDAYIIFRSVEQLFAGNGPTWNPHERVQTFTSPLWFWMLASTRIFSSNLYMNTMVVSILLWTGTLFILRKIFRNDLLLLASVLLFAASTGFYDYTSSGLENGLAYFLIALYLYLNTRLFEYQNTHRKSEHQLPTKKMIFLNLFVYGLIICIRHDLALLFFPITVYIIWKFSYLFTFKKWISIIVVSLSPFILWTLFSFFYYGFPFPNTAYAKINTGIDKFLIMKQGAKYFISSILFDSITLVIIGTAVFICMSREKNDRIRFFGYGIVLNMVYIVYVGGDFMQGRFFSYAFVISSIIVLQQFVLNWPKKCRWFGLGILIVYLFLYPNTPFSTPLDYQNYRSKLLVSNERGIYFNKTSLYNYLVRGYNFDIFPAHKWSYQGLKFKRQEEKIMIFGNIGFMGYWAGTEKIIIDPLALADPLLARIPVKGEWRVGHYLREIPDGYIESIKTNRNVIENPGLRVYYDKIKTITQSEKLLTFKRIKTILFINLGVYTKNLEK